MTSLASRIERFWSHVSKADGCWEWTAYRDPAGYGRLGAGSKKAGVILAHRFSWIIHFGPIPEGIHVCHHCDNPPCVRPEHLFLGSNADNHADMRAKGRSNYGDRNAMRRYPEKRHWGEHNGLRKHPERARHKLTDEQVRAIRQTAYKWTNVERLALEYQVSPNTIRNVMQNRYYSHVI